LQANLARLQKDMETVKADKREAVSARNAGRIVRERRQVTNT